MPITRSYANKARQSDKASGPRHHIRRFWQLARGTRSRDRERRQEAARLEQPLHRLAPDHARQRDELVHKLGCWGFWGACLDEANCSHFHQLGVVQHERDVAKGKIEGHPAAKGKGKGMHSGSGKGKGTSKGWD